MPIRSIRSFATVGVASPVARLAAPLVALVASLSLGGAACAADLLVPSQYPTIQAAVNASGFSGTIKVDPGIYTETVTYAISSTSTPSTLRIECSDPNGYFTMMPNGRAFRLDLLTLTPTGFPFDSKIELVGCKVVGARAPSAGTADAGLGGAIYFEGRGLFERCWFEGCRAESDTLSTRGGAIYSYGSVTGGILVKDCRFVANGVRSGSTAPTTSTQALYAQGGAIYGYVPATRCWFESNSAEVIVGATSAPIVVAAGGAVYGSTPSMCTFRENRAIATAASVATIARAIGGAECQSSFLTNSQKNRYYRNSVHTSSGNTAYAGAGDAIGGAIGSWIPSSQYGSGVYAANCIFVENSATKTPLTGTSRVAGDVANDGVDSVDGSGGPLVLNNCRIIGSSWTTAPGFVTGSVVATAPPASSNNIGLYNSMFCGFVPSVVSSFIPLVNTQFLETCPDCNGDGIDDLRAIVLGIDPDANYNGIPDICETTYFVPSQYATIQAAIAAVPADAARTIQVAPGTYSGPIDFLGKDIALVGSGPATCTIDGSAGETKSVVQLSNAPSTARIEGFTIKNGATGTPLPGNESALCGGGIFAKDSQASVVNCVIESNTAGFGGGAYFFDCGGSVVGCTFRSNLTNGYGGGMQLFRCTTLVDDCVFEANTAVVNGGGLHTVLGSPVVRGTTLASNYSYAGGGGLSWDAGGSTAWSLRVENSLITKNDSQSGVGGVRVFPTPQSATMTLVATEVCGNADGNIEGFYTADAASTVCDCAGDVDGSGVVNGVDLSALLSVWGTSGTQYPRADANRDGLVTAADLAIVLSSWGPCAP